MLREVDRQLDGRYLACSRQLVEEIEDGGLTLGRRVSVVPNWVVGPAPGRRGRFLPGRRDAPDRQRRARSTGNKGADHIIEMAARLRRRGIERFSVDFYGHVDDLFFPALTKFRGLEGHITFKGARPQAELARLYPLYDVFAFPTWAREPFAFAPLEAMWRGCVPLMSMSNGNAEWFVHGVHCLKSERTPDAFADAVGAIIDGSIDLEPIARRGASAVGRDFHLDAQVPKIERALAQAMLDGLEPRIGAPGLGRRGLPDGPPRREVDQGPGPGGRGNSRGGRFGLDGRGSLERRRRSCRSNSQRTASRPHAGRLIGPRLREGEASTMEHLAFYKVGCEPSPGLRPFLRRKIARLLRPIFLRLVEILGSLCHRLDVDEKEIEDLRDRVDDLRRRQEDQASKLPSTLAFGWDYIAMVRRLAILEEHVDALLASRDVAELTTSPAEPPARARVG